MKAVVQRVIDASVTVEGESRGRVSRGLLVYLGVAINDTAADAGRLAAKIPHLRIFDDSEGKMNLSLLDIVNLYRNQVNDSCVNQAAETVNHFSVNRNNICVNNKTVNRERDRVNEYAGVLTVSQFTLTGDARKGRRPSWAKAASPEKARELYIYFMDKIRETGLACESGEFQTRMRVTCTNDGPVTILLDSREL